MKTYANLGGKSTVASYEYGPTYITVQFASGKTYTYSYEGAGKSNVDQMKELADSGSGLNSFIRKNVDDMYDK